MKMSRTKHSKGGRWGKEWWGKRPLAHYEVSHNSGVNKWFKRLLHKTERRQDKEIIEIEKTI